VQENAPTDARKLIVDVTRRLHKLAPFVRQNPGE
jgi:hypothetical protein